MMIFTNVGKKNREEMSMFLFEEGEKWDFGPEYLIWIEKYIYQGRKQNESTLNYGHSRV